MNTPEAIARVEELGQSTYWTEEEISDARTLCPRLARELKEAREALEWQPIETAPRDGTRMQGWNRNGWIPKMRNHERTGWQYVEKETWWGFPDYEQPTHWKPLPAPPQPSTK